MNNKSWTLESGKTIQQEAPYTFYLPSDDIICRLKPEEATVKLIFKFTSSDPSVPNAERMWVIINTINEDGSYTGTLDNAPYYIEDLKAGDKIDFNREHIIQYDTLDELDIPDINAILIEQYRKRCYVSNQIMKDDCLVGRLYRDEPEKDMDSGWVLLSDLETGEYMDDGSNFQYISLGAVLNKDDAFVHLLEEPVGSEFVKDKLTGNFISAS